MATIAGVDRYRRGWVMVVLDPLAVGVAPRLSGFLDPDAECIGVDMPIGLRAEGLRECDVLARRCVGPRWSSVFMTPPREVLRADSYAAANELAPRLMGAKISQQAWALRHTIFEVEQLDDPRVIEVHPEVSFATMAGGHLAHAKSSWNGQMLRRRILAEQGIELPDELAGEAGRVPVDDVLDAAAVAWSAARYARGAAGSLPQGARRGQREVIWF